MTGGAGLVAGRSVMAVISQQWRVAVTVTGAAVEAFAGAVGDGALAVSTF